ncbi:MAG: DNA-deoxyinosine glycosylase [Woeseiaceae bacterium]
MATSEELSAGRDHSTGFPPVARADARVLVLGSLPGRRSIAADQYYAHPQNAFWRIMADLVAATGDYVDRCETLMGSRIALWDVLATSVRPGSMDADIEMATAKANDFDDFLTQHSDIGLICFNGQKAAQLFSRFVEPDLNHAKPTTLTLPSTSPAYAAMSYAEKRENWHAAIATSIPTAGA